MFKKMNGGWGKILTVTGRTRSHFELATTSAPGWYHSQARLPTHFFFCSEKRARGPVFVDIIYYIKPIVSKKINGAMLMLN